MRLGRAPSRPRWRRVPRRARHAPVSCRSSSTPSRPVAKAAHRVRNEWVLRVEGTVRPRPDGTVNADLPTGEIEVGATAVEVLNEAEPPPFPLDDRADIDEVLRLRHRYLDLRRVPMQRNLRVRADVNRALREAMRAQDFVEVETPMLIASTPEGARLRRAVAAAARFVLRAAAEPAAVQAAAHGRRPRSLLPDRACLRDEDLRADRQFEFMQLDVEMSFADQEDVLSAVSPCSRPPKRCPGDAPTTVLADDLARRDGALRLRQARHASAWSWSSSPRCSRRPSSARSPARRR